MIENTDLKRLLGKRIKELRIKNKFTQEKLSEMIGIGERNLSKIECGNNFLTAETLSNLVKALNIQPSELFNFEFIKTDEEIKKELVDAINSEKVDIKMLFKFYKSIT